MALATRCPHCQTAFRVASDQLKLRAGLVRCGTCKEIFNGIENLLHPDEDIGAANAAPALPVQSVEPTLPALPAMQPSQSPAPGGYTNHVANYAASYTAVHPTLRPDRTDVTNHSAADDPQSVPLSVAVAATERDALWAALDGDIDLDRGDLDSGDLDNGEHAATGADPHLGLYNLGEPAVAPPPIPLRRIDADTFNMPGLLRPARIDDDDATGLTPPAAAGLVRAAGPAALPMPDGDVGADTDTSAEGDIDVNARSKTGQPVEIDADAIADADADAPAGTDAEDNADVVQPPAPATPDDAVPDFITRSQRREGMQRVLRPALWIGAVLLALLLAAQVVYTLRAGIAANFPALRPTLETTCQVLGCSVGLPMQIDAVTIDSSDFQPVADSAERFQLSVLLRNRSSTVQAWPTIELSLTDAAEKIVGRRLIAASDYLPAAQTVARGFGAGGEQALKLTFDLAGLKASGYRIYLFYP